MKKKELARSEKMAKFIKTAAIATNAHSLIKSIILAVVMISIMLILIIRGLPLYIGGFFIAFSLLLVAVNIISLKRISSADISPSAAELTIQEKKTIIFRNIIILSLTMLPITFATIFLDIPYWFSAIIMGALLLGIFTSYSEFKNMSSVYICVLPNEKITDYIAGIMRSFNIRGRHRLGYSALGRGRVLSSNENAMIITNKSIYLIHVPLAGSNLILAGTDISMLEFMAAKKDIEKKIKNMIKKISLQEILDATSSDFVIRIDDIESIKIGKLSKNLIFMMKDNSQHSYGIRDEKDRERARRLFKIK
ncbi:MAG: hypothetical protein GOV02_03385 [Candidatus Aenigmarchaeota archaeon]|nr:hypothetical protein [Candidatus Aenigmarchaeota archaeon]